MKGQEIVLLDRKLSQILGEPERETQVFDDEVKALVLLFQRWQNMYVDGTGEQTLRRLDCLLSKMHLSWTLQTRSVTPGGRYTSQVMNALKSSHLVTSLIL